MPDDPNDTVTVTLTMTDAELQAAYAHNVRARGSIPTPFGPKRQARIDALLAECRVIRAEQHRRAGTRPLSDAPNPTPDADAERAMADYDDTDRTDQVMREYADAYEKAMEFYANLPPEQQRTEALGYVLSVFKSNPSTDDDDFNGAVYAIAALPHPDSARLRMCQEEVAREYEQHDRRLRERDEYRQLWENVGAEASGLEERLRAAEARAERLEAYVRYCQPCQHHGSAVSRSGLTSNDPVFSDMGEGGDDDA